MARKRTSLIEDIFDMTTQLPWWIGVVIAGGIWLVGLFFFGGAPKNSPSAAFHMLIRWCLNFLAIVVLVAAAVSAVKQLLRRSLLDRQSNLPSLRSLSWREFEQLVGEAYRRQGYDVEETGGGGADGGIDLILRGHGETVLVQCKQWRAQLVGVDKVRELFGVLTAEHANRGILVTSGTFTNEAQTFKVGKPLVLVDGPALNALVQEVRAPLTRTPPTPPGQPSQPITTHPPAAPAATPPVCPKCGAPMSLRTARRGTNAGNQFYGCSRYPDCKGIRDI
jgi:restriction system protein